MATATLPAGATRADARVRADLAQAALRIRVRDAAAGGLGLVALALLYVAVTVSLDKALELSAAARWCGLLLFAGLFGAVAFFGVVRPLRRRVNPRYAARQVERASPGAKNAVINYVDLEDADLAESVRASLAGRAADEVAAADARKLSESRLTTGLLVACGLLAAVLAGQFLWLKPAPFWSLLTRAFHPNTVATIATRSEIHLDAPAGGDVTVLAGESLPVAVTIQGRVPDHRDPDRPRLLVKYNPDAEPEEVPLPPAGSAREFAAVLSPGTVQNGFWYAVAAGDARTPEFRVTVKPRPAVLEYEVEYAYPKYTRLRPEAARDPKVVAVRGTEVTLTVTANRAVRDGALKLSYQAADLPGEAVPGAPDRLRFRFPATESGTYSVGFTTADGEPGDRTPDQRVIATADAKPVVTIAAPAAEEVALPAAARLAVDGAAADDYGVAGVSLRMQLAGPVPVALKSVGYRPETPLKRAADGSFPTAVEVKLSAELAQAKLATGEPAKLAEGTVVEYWLEAQDNCEPVANVGKSKVQRVKVAPPAKTPDEQKQQRQAGDQRQGEEQKHGQQQDQQFNNENRQPAQPRGDQPQPPKGPNPPKPQNPPQGEQPKGNDGQPQQGDPQGANGQPQGGDPKAGANQPNNGQPPAGANPPQPQPGANPNPPAGQDPQPPMNPPAADPTGNPPGTGAEPKTGAAPPPGNSQQSTPGSKDSTAPEQQNQPGKQTPEQRKLDAERDKVQRELNKQTGKPPADPSQSDPAGGQRQPAAAERKEVEDAARDLNSTDPDKKAKAEKTLDEKIGPDNRKRAQEQAEQLKDDLQSKEPNVQQAARQKLDDIAKQAGTDAKPQPGAGRQPEPDPAAAAGAARDLADPDPAKRQRAAESLDQSVGPKNREALQQQAQDAAADRAAGKPGEADKKLDDAAKRAGEMAKQVGKQGQPGGGQQPQKPDPKEMEQLARDLAGNDPAKKKAAEDKLDGMIGQKNRVAAQEKAEQLKDDLRSGDPKRADKARKEIEEAAKQAQKGAGNPGGPQPKTGEPQNGQPGGAPKPDAQAVEKAAKDLASDDAKTREGAAKTMKDAVGEPGAKELQKQADDIRDKKNAGGAGADEKANAELNDLAQKAKGQAAANAGQPGANPNKPDPKAVQDAVNKLATGTPAEKEAARKELDKQVGPDARKQAEQDAADIQKGLASDKPEERAAAGQKLADAAKKAGEQAAKGGAGRPDPKALADAAKELNSPDPAARAKAEKTIDDAIGKEDRQAAQAEAKKLADDLKSGDKATRDAAEQKLKDIQAKAAQPAGDKPRADGPQPQPSPADVEKWKKAADDLTSDDKTKRDAAEEQFNKALGEPGRQELQKDLKDLKDGTPEQQQAARDRLQQKADRAAKEDARRRGPGGGFEQPGDKLVENEKNRLKTAELQLTDFEKVKADPTLRDRIGYTEAEYERFLNDVRASVERQRAAVAQLEANAGKGGGPASVVVSGRGKADGRGGASAAGSGPGTAAPGYAEAQKRFAEEAARVKKAGQK